MKLPEAPGEWNSWRPWLAERADELKTAVAFATRLPLPFPQPAPIGGAIERAALGQAVWALPVAGLLVGLIGGVVYAVALRSGVPAWPAAGLALAATLLTTGCLHEDGLADAVDGFGGGETREQKLAIMRDARIGAYGVCALALSILIRGSALASFADAGAAIWALLAAHGGARATMALMMFFVPPARSDGLSFEAGRPPAESAAAAAVIGVLILIAGLGFVRAIEAAVLLAILIAAAARFSRQQIGGQTGDVLGALEQAGEIVILLLAVR
jgi:adenosylcobinamide-GDP ribazoletransferase